MNPHRFNGIKIDLDSLDQAGKENLAYYTAQRAAQALSEIALLAKNGIIELEDFPAAGQVLPTPFRAPTSQAPDFRPTA